MTTTWHTRLAWATRTDHPASANSSSGAVAEAAAAAAAAEETLADVLDDLAAHSPVGSIAPDGSSGTVMIALDAPSLDGALESALAVGRDALQKHFPGSEVVGLEILTSETLERELELSDVPHVERAC